MQKNGTSLINTALTFFSGSHLYTFIVSNLLLDFPFSYWVIELFIIRLVLHRDLTAQFATIVFKHFHSRWLRSICFSGLFYSVEGPTFVPLMIVSD